MTEATMDPKTQESIKEALAQNWDKALELNKELVKKYPDDIGTLNRLARAYLELGQISKAKTNYNKVLKIDPYNSIAEKNIKKLKSIKGKNVSKDLTNNEVRTDVDPDIFLEEPGKTKVLSLIDLAMLSILANIKTGDQTSLKAQGNDVIVYSAEGKRLGKIESEWAERLAKAIRSGSVFVSLVKSVQIKGESTEPSVSIFIKETYHSPKLSSSIFPTATSHFTPYVKENTINILSEKARTADSSEILDEENPGELPSLKGLPETNSQTDSLESLAEKESQDEDIFDDE